MDAIKTHYYAVIFTSVLKTPHPGYDEMALAMEALARAQLGFIDIISARDPSTGLGITVSYWKDLESIEQWKQNADHQAAQRLGKERWYERFDVKISRIERV